jgi:hypothetical protein
MKRALPWVVVAFFVAFYVFQSVGYQRERARQETLQTIEGQAATLQRWLGLSDEQTRAYRELRHAIVAKEKEFADYRRADAKAFWKTNTENIPDDEKLHILKERHLAKLKEIKAAELDLWSAWIDTLTFDQRTKYLGKVFEHRPLDTSWYDRDFFDDL